MRFFRILLTFIVIVTVSGCTTSNKTVKPNEPTVERIDGATIETARSAKSLGVQYSHLIFNEFEVNEAVEKSYPAACGTCREAIINSLKQKNAYANVTGSAAPPYPARTLIVDGSVEDARIIKKGGRALFGAMLGTSYMTVRIKLTDAETRKVVYDRIISSNTNPMGAAYSAGFTNYSPDEALPGELGCIIGEYIYTMVPAHP